MLACTISHLPRIGVFFFADAHKKGNRLGCRSLPGQGCRGSAPAPAVGTDVFCCGLLLLMGSPWDPIWTSAAGGEIESKGQGGEGGKAGAGLGGQGGHGTWAPQGWVEDSPAGSLAGAGIRRLCQQLGLAGTAMNSSVWEKLEIPTDCSSPKPAPAQAGRRPGQPPGPGCAGGHGCPCGLGEDGRRVVGNCARGRPVAPRRGTGTLCGGTQDPAPPDCRGCCDGKQLPWAGRALGHPCRPAAPMPAETLSCWHRVRFPRQGSKQLPLLLPRCRPTSGLAAAAGDRHQAANKSQLRGERLCPAAGRDTQDNAHQEENLPPSACASH